MSSLVRRMQVRAFKARKEPMVTRGRGIGMMSHRPVYPLLGAGKAGYRGPVVKSKRKRKAKPTPEQVAVKRAARIALHKAIAAPTFRPVRDIAAHKAKMELKRNQRAKR